MEGRSSPMRRCRSDQKNAKGDERVKNEMMRQRMQPQPTGLGSEYEPFNISEEDEPEEKNLKENFTTRHQRLQGRQKEKREEDELDELLIGSGIPVTDMPIEEKRLTAEVLRKSKEDATRMKKNTGAKQSAPRNDPVEQDKNLGSVSNVTTPGKLIKDNKEKPRGADSKSSPKVVKEDSGDEGDHSDFEVTTPTAKSRAKSVKKKIPKKAKEEREVKEKTTRKTVNEKQPVQDNKTTASQNGTPEMPEKRQTTPRNLAKKGGSKQQKIQKSKSPVYTKISISSSNEDQDQEVDNRQVRRTGKTPNKKDDKKSVNSSSESEEEIERVDKKRSRKKGTTEIKVKVKVKINKPALGEASSSAASQDEVVDEGHQAKTLDQGLKQRAVRVPQNSDPYSGVSTSQDIFLSQPKEQQGDEDEIQFMEVDEPEISPCKKQTTAVSNKAALDNNETEEIQLTAEDTVDDDETQEMELGPDGPVPVSQPPIKLQPPNKTQAGRSGVDAEKKESGVTNAKAGNTGGSQEATTSADGGEPEGFDVYYESAIARTTKERKEGRKTPVNVTVDKPDTSSQDKESIKDAESEEKEKRCPYCTSTPSPPLAKSLINKTKLRMNLFDPEPYYTPPGVDPVSHTETILGYFRSYHKKLREAQTKSNIKVGRGEPVQAGRHCRGNLFAKIRGKPERVYKFDFDDEDDIEALPDLETNIKRVIVVQTKQTKLINQHADLQPGEIRPVQVYKLTTSNTGQERQMEPAPGEVLTGAFYKPTRKRQNNQRMFSVEDNEEDSDFVPEQKTSRSGKKTGPGKTTTAAGRPSRKKLMQLDATSQYFSNEKRAIKRKAPAATGSNTKHKGGIEMHQHGGTEAPVEIVDLGPESEDDDVIPPTQPTVRKQTISQHSNTTVSRSTALAQPLRKDKLIKSNVLSPTRSRSNSPLPFRLSGGNTMAYEDSDTDDDEVGVIMKKDQDKETELDEKTGELVAKKPSSEKTSRTKTDNWQSNKGDEKVEIADDDFQKFKDIQEPAPGIFPGNRGKQGRGVKRTIQPPTNNTKRLARGTRGKSRSPVEVVENDNAEQGDKGESEPQQNAAQASQGRIFRNVEGRRPLRDRVGEAVYGPGFLNPHQARNPQQIVRPTIATIFTKAEESVDCPLCSKAFGKSLIEHHAAECNGISSSPEGAEGEPAGQAMPRQHVEEIAQPRRVGQPRHAGEPRRATPAAAAGRAPGNAAFEDSDSEEDQWTTITRQNPRANAAEGAGLRPGFVIPKMGRTGENKQQPPAKVEMGDCPICGKCLPVVHLMVHANQCVEEMEEQEKGEQEEPSEIRRTRATNHIEGPGAQAPPNVMTQQLQQLNQDRQRRLRQQQLKNQRAAQTPSPQLVLDSDEEEGGGGDQGNHKTQAKQSYIQDGSSTGANKIQRQHFMLSHSTPKLSDPNIEGPPSPVFEYRKACTIVKNRTKDMKENLQKMDTGVKGPNRLGRLNTNVMSRMERPNRSDNRDIVGDDIINTGEGSVLETSSESSSGSDDDSNDPSSADDDVPIGLTLNARRRIAQNRPEDNDTTETTNTSFTHFRRISAMQPDCLIDFRNQFRRTTRAQAGASGTRGRGGKRKRSTRRKKKGRKKRKVSGNTVNGKTGGKQTKVFSDAW